MKRNTFLDAEKENIVRLYAEGNSTTQIAKRYGVWHNVILGRLKSWGVDTHDKQRNSRIAVDKETVRRMYWDEEMHPVQIAKIYGCHKQVIVNRMKEWGIPLRTKSQARMGSLNPIYRVGHTEAARKKMSEAFSNGRKMGFHGQWGNGSYYSSPNQGTVWMRSGWEVKTADYLTEHGLDWYYEKSWIEISEDMHYLPDFYLPECDLYIEVKGNVDERALFIKDFMESSGYNYFFWNGEELFKRKIVGNPGSTEIFRKYRYEAAYVDDWESLKIRYLAA